MIVARTKAQGVVATETVDDIVACASVDHVVARRAIDDVGAGPADDGGQLAVPDTDIVYGGLLDPVPVVDTLIGGDGDDEIISTDINYSGPSSPYQVINNICDGGPGNDYGPAGCASPVSIP
jgi:hypothetical protein